MEDTAGKTPRSALVITGLVLGILALLTSLLPIVNNMSFLVALLGAIFSIAGLIACARGKRAGKGLAIVAIIVNVVAVVAVLGSQALYGAAIDEATKGPQVSSTTQSAKDDADADDSKDDVDDAATAQELAVGASVELDNGVTVTVDSVTPGLTNYDGSTVTAIHVTYVNNGPEAVRFSSYDWKSENAEGTRKGMTYYSEAEEELSNGSIAAGGSAAGNIYAEGDSAKVLYFGSPFRVDDVTATWVIS
ncbi:MAG: hypothetical protein SOU51_00565 [Collinsella sp.]|nr:hypothetical protein [Collinsella sp.]